MKTWPGLVGVPPASPILLSAWMPGVCPVLTAWAGRRLSRDLHTPLVRLCSGAARMSAALPC